MSAAADRSSDDSRSTVESFATAHPVATFAILAYAGSWTIDFAVLAVGMEPSWTRWFLTGFLSALAPPVAAAVVVSLRGGSVVAWARQIVRWRVHPKWYAAAVGVPLVVTAGAVAFAAATGGPLDLAGFDLAGAVPTVAIGVVLGTLVGGGQEEGGWRGFAQPYLQARYGALRAALAVGVLWAGWHLPLFLDPTAPHARWSPVEQAAWVVSIVGFSVLLAWLYNGTASVLLAMLGHGADNAMGALVPIDVEAVLVDGTLRFDLLWGVYVGNALAVWLLVGVVVAVYGGATLSSGRLPTPRSLGFGGTADGDDGAEEADVVRN